MGHPTCRAEGPRTRGWGEGEGQAGRPGRATAKWVERLPSPQRETRLLSGWTASGSSLPQLRALCKGSHVTSPSPALPPSCFHSS